MEYLQQTVTKGRYTLPLAVFITVLGWGGVYLLLPDLPAEGGPQFREALVAFLPPWSVRLLSLLVYLAVGYFLIQFNNTFLLIRRRASMQTSILLLYITACPVLHTQYMAGLATIFMLFSVYHLFRCYQNPAPMGYIFNSFVFLGLAALLFPHLLLFAPIFLFGVSYIHSLGLRNFLAALLGLTLPVGLLWSYAYLTGDMDFFYSPFRQLATFQPLTAATLQHPGLVTILYFLVVFAVGAAYCLSNANKDKISTRIYLRFLITLVFCLLVYALLQPGAATFLLPLTQAGVSILAAHYFVLTNSKASNLFFICTVVGLICLYGFNIWMLY